MGFFRQVKMFIALLVNPDQNMGYGELFVDVGLMSMLNIYSFIYFDFIFELNQRSGHLTKMFGTICIIFH